MKLLLTAGNLNGHEDGMKKSLTVVIDESLYREVKDAGPSGRLHAGMDIGRVLCTWYFRTQPQAQSDDRKKLKAEGVEAGRLSWRKKSLAQGRGLATAGSKEKDGGTAR